MSALAVAAIAAQLAHAYDDAGVAGVYFEDDGSLDALLPQLLGSPLLRGAELLALTGSRIGGDDGARRIAESPGCASLAVLDLAFCEVRDDGLEALLASPHLARLERIVLDANSVDEHGAKGERHWPDLCARLEARRIELVLR